MTAKFERNNTNTNLVIEYENISPLPEQTIEDMAHELWERGQGDHGTDEEPIVWEDLEEDDYLEMSSKYLQTVILNMAGSFVHADKVAVANVEAEEIISATHGLGVEE